MRRRVSVIITAHDAEATIGDPLTALGQQRLPEDVEMDIIVVDDRCNDGTATRACEHAASAALSLRVARISTPPLAGRTARQAALDAGIDLSSADFLLFLDADAIPAENWVSEMLTRLSVYDAVSSPIRYRAVPQTMGGACIAALQSVDAAYYHLVSALVAAAQCPTGICFGGAGVRRSALSRIGTISALGFTLTEDLELARAAHAIGLRVGFSRNTTVTARSAPSLTALRERALRVTATGGVSALALALVLPVATLPLMVGAAMFGFVPWWGVAARWIAGAALLLYASWRTGSVRAWPATLLYECGVVLMALAVAHKSRRASVVSWGGIEYPRQAPLAVAQQRGRR